LHFLHFNNTHGVFNEYYEKKKIYADLYTR
jgi:hypothetical protein